MRDEQERGARSKDPKATRRAKSSDARWFKAGIRFRMKHKVAAATLSIPVSGSGNTPKSGTGIPPRGLGREAVRFLTAPRAVRNVVGRRIKATMCPGIKRYANYVPVSQILRSRSRFTPNHQVRRVLRVLRNGGKTAVAGHGTASKTRFVENTKLKRTSKPISLVLLEMRGIRRNELHGLSHLFSLR